MGRLLLIASGYGRLNILKGRLTGIVFNRNCSTKPSFREALMAMDDRKFVPIRIKQFLLGDSFSRARIDFTKHYVDKNGNAIDELTTMKRGEVFLRSIRFNSMFSEGLEQLKLFSSGHQLTDDQLNFTIHSFLYGFWNRIGFHEKCLENIQEEKKENKITVLLANHLFSKLTNAMGKHYLVDHRISKFEVCPCMGNCGEIIEYGSTGIGSEYLWYGYPDILLLPPGGSKVSVVLPKSHEDEDDVSLSIEDKEKQAVDIKINSKDLRKIYNIRQFIAQTLTFAVYQKINHSHSWSDTVSIIPTIALSAESFDVYFYDIKHDILLRNDGDPIPLWRRGDTKKKLDLSSVLMLWMVVNHLSMKPAITQAGIKKLKGSCNFLPHFSSDELENIEANLNMRSYFRPSQEEELDAVDLPVDKITT